MEIDPEDMLSFELEKHLIFGKFNLEAAEEILKSGYDVNRVCYGREPILLRLIRYCNDEDTIKGVELVLKYGAGSDIKEDGGKYITLIWFYAFDRREILETLLEKGLDPNIKIGNTPVIIAMINSRQWKQAKLLYDYGADMNFIVDENIKRLFFENCILSNIKPAVKVSREK